MLVPPALVVNASKPLVVVVAVVFGALVALARLASALPTLFGLLELKASMRDVAAPAIFRSGLPAKLARLLSAAPLLPASKLVAILETVKPRLILAAVPASTAPPTRFETVLSEAKILKTDAASLALRSFAPVLIFPRVRPVSPIGRLPEAPAAADNAPSTGLPPVNPDKVPPSTPDPKALEAALLNPRSRAPEIDEPKVDPRFNPAGPAKPAVAAEINGERSDNTCLYRGVSFWVNKKLPLLS